MSPTERGVAIAASKRNLSMGDEVGLEQRHLGGCANSESSTSSEGSSTRSSSTRTSSVMGSPERWTATELIPRTSSEANRSSRLSSSGEDDERAQSEGGSLETESSSTVSTIGRQTVDLTRGSRTLDLRQDSRQDLEQSAVSPGSGGMGKGGETLGTEVTVEAAEGSSSVDD